MNIPSTVLGIFRIKKLNTYLFNEMNRYLFFGERITSDFFSLFLIKKWFVSTEYVIQLWKLNFQCPPSREKRWSENERGEKDWQNVRKCLREREQDRMREKERKREKKKKERERVLLLERELKRDNGFWVSFGSDLGTIPVGKKRVRCLRKEIFFWISRHKKGKEKQRQQAKLIQGDKRGNRKHGETVLGNVC